MMHTTEHQLEIKIVIKCYDNLPDDSKYLAYIENYDDAKCIGCVQSSSVGGCLKELGTSINVLEQYRKSKL